MRGMCFFFISPVRRRFICLFLDVSSFEERTPYWARDLFQCLTRRCSTDFRKLNHKDSMDYNGARFWGEYTLCKNSVARPIFKIFISNTEHIFNHIGWAMWNYLYFGSLMKMRRVTAWNSTFHTSCCHRNVLFILSGLLPF